MKNKILKHIFMLGAIAILEAPVSTFSADTDSENCPPLTVTTEEGKQKELHTNEKEEEKCIYKNKGLKISLDIKNKELQVEENGVPLKVKPATKKLAQKLSQSKFLSKFINPEEEEKEKEDLPNKEDSTEEIEEEMPMLPDTEKEMNLTDTQSPLENQEAFLEEEPTEESVPVKALSHKEGFEALPYHEKEE